MSFDPNIFAGDLMCMERQGKFHISKVIKVDLDTQTYHILSYFPVDEKPAIDALSELGIFVMHSPIASFENSEKIGHIEVTDDDLQGFYYYLKTNDFRRYCEETNQDLEELIKGANTAFREGYAFTDDKRYDEAIAKYLEAIELYPFFYEAIDNMAFVKMNKERWSDAIDDFRWSLEIEPKSVLAEFSIGECYMRMGQLEEAKEQFEIALELEEDNPLALDFLAKVEGMIAGNPVQSEEESENEGVAEDGLVQSEEESENEEVAEDGLVQSEEESGNEEASCEADNTLDDYLNTPIEDDAQDDVQAEVQNEKESENEEASDEAEAEPEPEPDKKKKWWRFGK